MEDSAVCITSKVSSIIHPYIYFLCRRMEQIYDAYYKGDNLAVFKGVKSLMLFLKRETREDNKALLERVDEVLKDINKTQGLNWVQTHARRSQVLQVKAVEELDRLVTALTDALFEGGYLRPEFYGLAPTAGEKMSGTRRHGGFPESLPSVVS